jgi:hypothetical protein
MTYKNSFFAYKNSFFAYKNSFFAYKNSFLNLVTYCVLINYEPLQIDKYIQIHKFVLSK